MPLYSFVLCAWRIWAKQGCSGLAVHGLSGLRMYMQQVQCPREPCVVEEGLEDLAWDRHGAGCLLLYAKVIDAYCLQPGWPLVNEHVYKLAVQW